MAQGAFGLQFCIENDSIQEHEDGRVIVRALNFTTRETHIFELNECTRSADGKISEGKIEMCPELDNQEATLKVFGQRISVLPPR